MKKHQTRKRSSTRTSRRGRPSEDGAGGGRARTGARRRGRSKRARGTRRTPAAANGDASDVPRGERLQKFLARAGLGSRRFCEELITAGRITVDRAVVTELGTRIDPVRQRVAYDGESIKPERPAYYLLYKPRGYLCTHSDPAGRPTVYDLLDNEQRRLFTVGRLDRESEGLLILTNDGEFANRLAHPSHEVEKTYVVTVKGSVPDGVIARLRDGVWLAEGKTQGAKVRVLRRRPQQTRLQVTLSEGRNRQIRRMLARFDFKVPSLVRSRIGPIGTGGLKPGTTRQLLPAEIQELFSLSTPPSRRENRGTPNRP